MWVEIRTAGRCHGETAGGGMSTVDQSSARLAGPCRRPSGPQRQDRGDRAALRHFAGGDKVMAPPQQDAVAPYQHERLPQRSANRDKPSSNSGFVDSGGCVAFSTPPQDGARTADVTHAAVLSQRRCCQINLILHVSAKPALSSQVEVVQSRRRARCSSFQP